jgi:RNA methyltransferase, TrmH family
MTYQRLTSDNSALLKTIRRLNSGDASGTLAAAEGIRVLEEAARSGSEIEAVVISEHFGATRREQALLEVWDAKGVRIRSVTDRVFKSISGVQTHQGAVALVRVPELVLDDMSPGDDALILIACRIQDPGNMGTLIRTAAAVGASMVVSLPGSVSVRNSKVIRSSAGALFRIPVVENALPAKVLDFCRSNMIQLYRTDVRTGTVYTKVDLRGPSALLLGNEADGISEKDFASLPAITIPMMKDSESLNVGMAGTVILFEAFRQRRQL